MRDERDPGRLPANAYHFVTTWQVAAPVAEVEAVVGDAAGLPRWWPSVYLDVVVVDPGAPDGVGRVIALYTKGFLPYTLHWTFRVTEVRPGQGFSLVAWGDFVGRGIWTFQEEAGGTRVTYDWRVAAEKGVLRRLSRIMKPLFSANHRWAMARGEESLRLEIARRRAAGDPAVLAALPDPPGPTFPHGVRAVRALLRRFAGGAARATPEPPTADR